MGPPSHPRWVTLHYCTVAHIHVVCVCVRAHMHAILPILLKVKTKPKKNPHRFRDMKTT